VFTESRQREDPFRTGIGFAGPQKKALISRNDWETMRLGRIRLEQAFLRNKVAQQLFLMFVLCALVPLAAMSAISYLQVSGQLNRQADERLRETSKSSGMNLIERLSFLESDLDFLVPEHSGIIPDKQWPANQQMRERLSLRYRGILLRSASGRVLARFGQAPAPIDFSRREIEHLSSGNPLVATREGRDGTSSVFIAKMCKIEDSSDAMILGEVNPAYLWENNSFLYSSGEIFIVNESMKVLYSSLPEKSPLRELEAALKKEPSGRLEWGSGADRFIGGYWTIFMRAIFLDTWIIVQSEKRNSVLDPLSSFQKAFMPIALLTFWVAALLSLTFIRRRMKPVEQLCEATQRVAAKDFQARVTLNNQDEFGKLGNAFNKMAEGLGGYFDTIQTVNKIGKSLSVEEDQTKLLETILKGTKSLTNADGAILSLVTENHQPTLSLIQIDSLGIISKSDYSSGGSGSSVFPESSAITSLLDCGTVCCSDIYSTDMDHFGFQKEFDRKTGYRTRSVLSVPLISHEGEGIGLLQLINARDRQDGSVIGFSEEDVRLAESLASQAAVALSKNRLMTELLRLFEGLTELIATAVDAKSPHTGDHCKRVPALTMMIAEAACRATKGPFRDFKLSADENYELRIAAMLHDCGKVATPVHIVDKATKLETIYDRIELIDTRFEILSRDKLIDLCRGKLKTLLGDAGIFQLQSIDQEWGAFVQQLEEDLQFLKECNSGRKAMRSAEQKWISEIADKYAWINRDKKRMPVLSADEVENLTIAEGTLTAQERAVVSEHVNLTIRMLQSLPLPKKLRNLPAFAGVHHERMDGKGYPQGLTREQISIQGRIISIADIFEALTATDRPYKRPRSVLEAVEILRSMKENGQIDPDLFDLFIQEKLYLQYADRFVNSQLTKKSG
jgi:HD-GYP domain-containing protein (c-di-GMP phosphodiesterase class II)/HAMP domain-containing protein